MSRAVGLHARAGSTIRPPCSPRFGIRSDIHMPFCPTCLNSGTAGISRAVSSNRSVGRVHLERNLVAGLALQTRLEIEQVHLRGAALHPEQDHALRFRREVRLFRRERIFASPALAACSRRHCRRAPPSRSRRRCERRNPRRLLGSGSRDGTYRYLLYRNSLEAKIAWQYRAQASSRSGLGHGSASFDSPASKSGQELAGLLNVAFSRAGDSAQP